MATMIVDEGTRNLMAWKCSTEDFMFGTQLVVHESQMAVFFRDGSIVEILRSGRHTLETENFPFLRKFTKLRFGRYFHCEVYFINLSVQKDIPWGIGDVNVFIEVEKGKKLPFKIGASGGMDLQIIPKEAPQLLIDLLGTGVALERSDIKTLFGSMMSTMIKTHLAKALQEENCNIFSLEEHLENFSKHVTLNLRKEFEPYGLELSRFFVSAIAYPYGDPVFQEAKLKYEQRYIMNAEQDLNFDLETKQAIHEADLAEIQKKKSRTEAETEAERTAILAQGEAIRRNYEGISSIQEHQFDTLNRMIDVSSRPWNTNGSMSLGEVAVGMCDVTGIIGDVMKVNMGAPITAKGNTEKSIGWTCEKCGHVNPADHAFCGKCGQAMPESKKNWSCPKCGRSNPLDNLFCGRCGTAKPEEMEEWFCGKCGKKNDARSNFCGRCGFPKIGN